MQGGRASSSDSAVHTSSGCTLYAALCLVSIVTVTCGCRGPGEVVAQVTFHELGADCLAIPFVGESSRVAYRDPVMGVAIREVIADGRSVVGNVIQLDDIDVRQVDIGGQMIVYGVGLSADAATPSAEAIYRLFSVTDGKESAFESRVFKIPFSAREIRIEYCIRTPDGALSPPKRVTLIALQD